MRWDEVTNFEDLKNKLSEYSDGCNTLSCMPIIVQDNNVTCSLGVHLGLEVPLCQLNPAKADYYYSLEDDTVDKIVRMEVEGVLKYLEMIQQHYNISEIIMHPLTDHISGRNRIEE